MKPVVLLLTCTSVALLLSACSSNRSPSPRLGDPELRDPNAPWFCQPGVERDEWECMQNEQLAQAPVPTRPPPERIPQQQAMPSTPQLTSRQTEPREQTLAALAPEAKSSTPQVTPEPDLPVPAATRAADSRPEYARLAFRPRKPISILDLPDDFSAVQLLAVSSREALEQHVTQSNMRGMSAARILSGDKLFYILLLGIYETRERAERAIVGLPPPLDRYTPWIRSVGSLQNAMLAADRHVGDR